MRRVPPAGEIQSPSGAVTDVTRSRIQIKRFIEVFFRLALVPAIVRGMPAYLGILLFGQLLLKAVPLPQILGAHPVLVAPGAAAWSLLLSHACAPLFGDPRTEYLRSLPVSNLVLAAAMLPALLCIDAPWVLLCLASGSPEVMVAGPLLSAALHIVLAARRWRLGLAAGALLIGSALAPPWVFAPLSGLLILRGTPLAFQATRVGRTTDRKWIHLPVPWWGLTRALWSAAIVTAPRLVRRVFVIQALTIGSAALAVRNNGYTSFAEVATASLIFLTLGFPLLLVRPAAGVIEAGWSLDWLCSATGSSPRVRTMAGVGVAVFCGSMLGLIHGTAVGLLVARPLAVSLAAIEVAVGGALAVVVLGLNAAAARPSGIDPGRQGGALVAATVMVPLAMGTSLTLGLSMTAAAALITTAVYRARVANPGHRSRRPC
jgi:hypothetical protein